MDYYEILGVSPSVSPQDLRKAYISSSLKYHPDRNSSENAKSKFQEIANAYSTLSDPIKRKDYESSKKLESNVDPIVLFTCMFDDLLIPEVPNPVYFWQLIGAIAGIILGFIIFNIPGAILGYYLGSRAGKVRDMKGVCVYEAFNSLPLEKRGAILADIAKKVLGTAITIKNS